MFRPRAFLTIVAALILAGCEAAPQGAASHVMPSPPVNSRHIEFASTVDGGGVHPETIGRSGFLVVDSEDKAIYVYDQDRGRFVGPAFTYDSIPQRLLPGYPFAPLGNISTPADALVDGQTVWVAGGPSSLILKATITSSGVSDPTSFQPAGAVPMLVEGGANGVKGQLGPGQDWMAYVAKAADGSLVIFSVDLVTHETSAWGLDLSGHTIRGKQPLTKGRIAATAKIGDVIYASFDNGVVGSLRSDLSLAPVVKLPAGVSRLTAVGSTLYASTSNPATLYRIDPTSGGATVLDSVAAAPFGGPVVSADDSLWWSVPSAGQVLHISPQGKVIKALAVPCKGIRGMAILGHLLGVVCGGPGQLVVIDVNSGGYKVGPAGVSPIGVTAFTLL